MLSYGEVAGLLSFGAARITMLRAFLRVGLALSVRWQVTPIESVQGRCQTWQASRWARGPKGRGSVAWRTWVAS